MTDPAPPLPYAVPAGTLRTADDDHLRLLAVFHFVLGTLEALVACVPVLYVILGVLMVSGRLDPSAPPQVRWIGLIFIVVPLLLVLAGWTLGALTFYSGLQMQRRRRRTLSLVVAGINCCFFPLGTALGVFTLVVLCRRSVEDSYRTAAC